MEELGIGRPSTYASILQVLKDRNYVRLEKKRLYAEDKGRVVVVFLENFFARYVEYDFTAGLEEELDRIANSEIDWSEVLRDFWRDFIGAVDSIKDVRVREVLDVLDEMLAPHLFPPSKDGTDPRVCPTCGNGRLALEARQVRRLHRLLELSGVQIHPPARPRERRGERRQGAGQGPGDRPRRRDQDGPLRHVSPARRRQQGREAEAREPSERCVARRHRPRNWRSSCSRCRARSASTPRMASRSSPASAGSVLTCSTARPTPSLEDGDEVLNVGLNRAVTLIAEKRANPGKGRRFGGDPGRSVGDHPQRGGAILVKKGRYGPYVTNNGINATHSGQHRSG